MSVADPFVADFPLPANLQDVISDDLDTLEEGAGIVRGLTLSEAAKWAWMFESFTGGFSNDYGPTLGLQDWDAGTGVPFVVSGDSIVPTSPQPKTRVCGTALSGTKTGTQTEYSATANWTFNWAISGLYHNTDDGTYAIRLDFVLRIDISFRQISGDYTSDFWLYSTNAEDTGSDPSDPSSYAELSFQGKTYKLFAVWNGGTFAPTGFDMGVSSPTYYTAP